MKRSMTLRSFTCALPDRDRRVSRGAPGERRRPRGGRRPERRGRRRRPSQWLARRVGRPEPRNRRVAARPSISACARARLLDRLGADTAPPSGSGSGTAAWRRARAAGWSPAAPAARRRRPGSARRARRAAWRRRPGHSRRPAPARAIVWRKRAIALSSRARASRDRAGRAAQRRSKSAGTARGTAASSWSTRKSMPCAWPISRSICCERPAELLRAPGSRCRSRFRAMLLEHRAPRSAATGSGC